MRGLQLWLARLELRTKVGLTISLQSSRQDLKHIADCRYFRGICTVFASKSKHFPSICYDSGSKLGSWRMSWHETAVSAVMRKRSVDTDEEVFQHNTFLTVDEEDEDFSELPPGTQPGTEANY